MNNRIIENIQTVHFNKENSSLQIVVELEQLTTRANESEFRQSILDKLNFIQAVEVEFLFSGEYSPYQIVSWQLARDLEQESDDLTDKFSCQLAGDKLSLDFSDSALYHRLQAQKILDNLANKINASFAKNWQIEIKLSAAEQVESEADFSARLEQIVAENMPEPIKFPKAKQQKNANDSDQGILLGKKISGDWMNLDSYFSEGDKLIARVELVNKELRVMPEGNKSDLISLFVSDHKDAIKAKLFVKKEDSQDLYEQLKKGDYYLIEGYMKFDNFDKALVLYPRSINKSYNESVRTDDAQQKRIEFHLHTNMSQLDGIASISDYIKMAKQWGHSGIGITDNGVVQAFPEAMRFDDDDFKIHYGMEAYIADDDVKIIDNFREYSLKDEFVVFDIETTGFSPLHDKITEIGAIKVKGKAIVDRFSQLVDPERSIPERIIEITGITDSMVAGKPTIETVLPQFLEFCGDLPLVAHNSDFDLSFIYHNAKSQQISYQAMVIDSLKLSRMLLKDIKRHKLNQVAKHLGVSLENHHRAVDDAVATAQIFMRFVEILDDMGIKNTSQLEAYGQEALSIEHFNNYHVNIYARNQAGIKSLYELVSASHIDYYHKNPLIPKSLLAQKRENLLIGSCSAKGEIFDGFLQAKEEAEMNKTAGFYDYFEVQPAENNLKLIGKGICQDINEIRAINDKIIALAERQNKLCIASGDVHYLNPEDEIYRRILILSKNKKAAEDKEALYFRSTSEMLESFAYLGEDKAEEIVVTNTHKLSEMMERVLPIPNETFAPVIEGSDQTLRQICYQNAIDNYGDPIPEIVKKRLDKELNAIIQNGYAVMYIIAQKLVAKSMQDGYLVGSRGSVGSSFAATMADITEVNPLPPHYRCPNCKYSQFYPLPEIKIGADLPDAVCPNCNSNLIKDGFDIPFETFLGFEGDKEPDIDLNFAGVYQGVAHAYTEELFGEGYTFKAGTIGTIADKTAYGYAMNYKEEKELPISKYEVERFASGIVGVKRTTGQHPGGIMVVPNYKDVHDFTPIQYPANDSSSGVKTTHFDYHSIAGKILKLDILGHEVPTTIKTLEDLTGLKYQDIALDDAEVLSLFCSTEALNIIDSNYPIDSGTLGIPEFGTNFVRGMLRETKPKTIEELVQISGLSHGTDVWMGNARDLVQNGTCSLKEVIGIRDNIMLYLIDKGLPKKESFFITEKVRKGKGLAPEQEALMREHEVPNWYIESCKKISYMFPKAHAAAYVMSSLRICYYKINYPIAYYCTYFSNKVEDFDADLISRGQDAVANELKKLKMQDKITKKEENLYTVLESALEMYARGFRCHKVDLYKSDAYKFIPLEDGILPPLQALKGVGKNAAETIAKAAKAATFMSVNDIKSRGKANSAVIEAMRAHGILSDLPEDNQLSLEFFMR